MNSVIIIKEIESQLKSIEASERMRELLEIRLCLLKTGYSKKSDYEKNECEILLLETSNKIERLKKIILIKTDEFQELYEEYISELEFESQPITE